LSSIISFSKQWSVSAICEGENAGIQIASNPLVGAFAGGIGEGELLQCYDCGKSWKK